MPIAKNVKSFEKLTRTVYRENFSFRRRQWNIENRNKKEDSKHGKTNDEKKSIMEWRKISYQSLLPQLTPFHITLPQEHADG